MTARSSRYGCTDAGLIIRCYLTPYAVHPNQELSLVAGGLWVFVCSHDR